MKQTGNHAPAGSVRFHHPIRFGLYPRLVVFSILLIILTLGGSSLFTHHQRQTALKQAVSSALLATVRTTAPLISADEIDALQRLPAEEFEPTEIYLKIRQQLGRVLHANQLDGREAGSLHILRRASDSPKGNRLEVLVKVGTEDSIPDPKAGEYPARPHLMSASAGESATTEVYKEDQLEWISAAAPILREDGSVAAVLLMNRPVHFLHSEAHRQTGAILAGAAISVFIASLLALWLAHGLVRPVRKLLQATMRFAQGQLDHRVFLQRDDELGDLGTSFNRMALQLQQSYTSIEQQKKELIQAYKEAQAANRAKSEFLATMSHEIRTPMNGIIGFNNLLLDGDLTDEQRGFAELVQQCATSLLTIINDILDLSRIEAGRCELDPAPFPLREVVESVTGLLAIEAQRKGLELALRVDEQIPATLIGDSNRLRQVLLNLVGNAVKFTRRGEVLLHIQQDASPCDSEIRLRFEVKDTGPGIDPEAMDHIFEPFTQADSSTTRRHGGTGLGLAISRRIIELMGGEIGVRSEVGQGSTFWFHISLPIPRTPPLSSAAHPDSTANTSHPEKTSPDCDRRSTQLPPAPRRSSETPEFRFSGLRVLIAEDNSTNRLLTVKLLRKLGCNPKTAQDGRQVLKRVEEEPWDIILMDCHMPEMDGIEATRRIRSREAKGGNHILIVALTASAMTEDRIRCQDAGMDAFLTKPVRREDLEQVFERFFGVPQDEAIESRTRR